MMESIEIKLSEALEKLSRLEKKVNLLLTSAQIEEIEEAEKKEKIKKTYFRNLPLSNRAKNSLAYAGIRTLEELTEITEKEFLRIRNVGKKTAIELTELLKEHGMDWKA